MNYCKKDNCYEICIPRGKYCINHRTNKKKENTKKENNQNIENTIEDDISRAINLSKLNYEKELEKNRILINEQDIEYEKAMKKDEEMFNKIRLKEELINNKKKKISLMKINNDNHYKIKIKTQKSDLILKLDKDSKILDIKDQIDVYFYDNNINIIDYNLIIQTKEGKKILNEINQRISNLEVPNNFLLYLDVLE
jgi:hypothetical protein